MRAGADGDERQGVHVDAIDEQPIRGDMTLAMALVLPHQVMVAQALGQSPPKGEDDLIDLADIYPLLALRSAPSSGARV